VSAKLLLNAPTVRTGVVDESVDVCRSNVVNYFVCYGSAVVSVRNAERESRSVDRRVRRVFENDLGQCQSQDIVVDMDTWSLVDGKTVENDVSLRVSIVVDNDHLGVCS
jgi:hypothetical protein